MKKLYAYVENFGRMGNLHGLFIVDEEVITKNIGRSVQFGEVLGKHSEIETTITEDLFEVLIDDQEWIEKTIEMLNLNSEPFGNTISGYNPLDYLYEDDEEEDNDE